MHIVTSVFRLQLIQEPQPLLCQRCRVNIGWDSPAEEGRLARFFSSRIAGHHILASDTAYRLTFPTQRHTFASWLLLEGGATVLPERENEEP